MKISVNNQNVKNLHKQKRKLGQKDDATFPNLPYNFLVSSSSPPFTPASSKTLTSVPHRLITKAIHKKKKKANCRIDHQDLISTESLTGLISLFISLNNFFFKKKEKAELLLLSVGERAEKFLKVA